MSEDEKRMWCELREDFHHWLNEPIDLKKLLPSTEVPPEEGIAPPDSDKPVLIRPKITKE